MEILMMPIPDNAFSYQKLPFLRCTKIQLCEHCLNCYAYLSSLAGGVSVQNEVPSGASFSVSSPNLHLGGGGKKETK